MKNLKHTNLELLLRQPCNERQGSQKIVNASKKFTQCCLFLLLGLLGFLPLAAQDFEWAGKLGGTDVDEGWSIAADASGNVYTAGTFKGTADFNPGAGVNQLTSNGQTDFFLSKVNSSGTYQWAAQFGGAGIEGAKPTVKTDPSGNVYLAGSFRNTVDFNPGAGTNEVTANGGSLDGFIVKLNSAGVFQWVKTITGAENINLRNLQVDGSGNAYVTGDFSGTVDFWPEGSALEETAQANNDSFVMKVSTSGVLSWAKVINTNSLITSYGLALDGSSNVYTSGTFYGTGDFDPGAGTANLTSAGGTDAFVTKWNSAGEYIWAKNFGGSSNAIGQDDDVANAIAVDHNGNVITTGFFRSTADFNPGPGVFEITSSGIMDIFVSKLDADGNFSWATALPGPGNNIGYDITVDALGNIYSTGQFGGQVDFDPGVDFHNLSSSGAEFDIFVSKLKSDGSFASAYRVGSTLRDRGYGIAVDADYSIYTTGYFTGGVDFDPTSGLFNMSSAGLADAFVLKMSQVVNIPDANFKAALVGNSSINTNMDAEISFDEAAAYAGTIDVVGLSIGSLSGIEYFPNIQVLNASLNNLSAIDVSGNTALTSLRIGGNNISALDVSSNGSLNDLIISDCPISSIDLTHNPLLKSFTASNNLISSIDLSQNTQIITLSIYNQPNLTSLDISTLAALTTLNLWNNELTSLDLSNNPLLINVSAYNNEISSVNLTGLTKVTDFNLTNNQLTSIDLSDMVKLDNLTLVGNELSSIDLTNNGTIRVLNVQSNNLTSLDISPLTNINWLYAQNNDLTSITMGSSTAMTILFLGGNELTSIDLSANTGLTDVRLMDNALTSLDFTSNTLLEKVFINNNDLQSVDIKNGNNAAITTFDATANPSLTCITVDNVAYAEANFTNIDSQTRFSLLCNSVNIPDANFKTALLTNASINTTDDGEISFEEAEAFTGTINVSNQSIADLTGIEAFINITALFANNNDLGSIDVSNNIDLQNLQVENCGLSSGMDISALTELTAFNGRSNGFTSIDLSNNTKISNLRLEFNELSSLDLSSNAMITQLRVANNPLMALDVSAQPNLTTLYADNTIITELDVSGNASLHTLSLINGALTSLNVANGNNASFVSFTVRFHSDLACITVDDVAFSETNWSDPDNNASFSTNCSNVETDILTFSIPEQTSATIDATTHTINVEVPDATDLTNLTPTLTISPGATIDPATGVAQDFSSAFVYTVTAQNPSVSQEWTVNVAFPKEEQTITFNPIEDQFLESETVTLTATASSGLPVVFEVTDGPASVEGNTLTMTATGSVTVRATQPGDATFAAADPVEQSFEIILITGIPEQRGPHFKFYPNPFDHSLVVIPNGSDNRLSLQDAQGRIVTTRESRSNDTIEIDVSSLPAGMYILKLSNEAGASQTKILKK